MTKVRISIKIVNRLWLSTGMNYWTNVVLIGFTVFRNMLTRLRTRIKYTVFDISWLRTQVRLVLLHNI